MKALFQADSSGRASVLPAKRFLITSKVLCMADLSLAPEARTILDEVAEVHYRASDRSVLLDIIGSYDAFWGHVDLKIDRAVLERVDFETLLKESDAISIHIHMTPENHHLFDATVLAGMKRNAIMVNTSRGDIVDEPALLAALERGTPAAYGADVIHDEWRDNMSQSPLIRYARDHKNVVITPHIGGCTYKSLVDARVFSARKLAHFLRTGEELCMPQDSSLNTCRMPGACHAEGRNP